LNLPTLPTTPTTPTTPSATPPAPADTASPAATILPVVPLEIRSIAEGTTGNVRELIARAEELMREGKFNSAIDQFDNADRISPDDPLIFMGRSIAELGASYYRRSEVHLRQAFERSPELLLARYDLKAMVGESRLEFLVGELKQLASSNATDPGPLMLLAFIHFSVDDAPRAKTLLEEAQRRAPNDRAVKIMQATWQTVNTPASNTPANDNK